MLTSKYIAHFLQEVSTWQKKLSTADQVIGIWMEVQRTWSHLESIFIGSEDIRNQLPEDSKRFDGIDTDFKVRYPFVLKLANIWIIYFLLLCVCHLLMVVIYLYLFTCHFKDRSDIIPISKTIFFSVNTC